MDSDFAYDPVTAVDEASASGQTAAIFADIRETMGIPLVTSIWRGLAGMGDGLSQAWYLAKPIYASGSPEHALARVVARTSLPIPEPLTPTQLACVGVGAGDVEEILAILAAYNRSNGMNLVALAALITPPAAGTAVAALPSTMPIWPPLRPLLPREAIDESTWTMVRHVNALGATGLDAGVATLWRHLAHWPGLLAIIHAAFAPLQVRGTIAVASAQVVALSLEEGARMAHLRRAEIELSRQVRDTITGYVHSPTQVARMVTMGHTLSRWLK